VGLIQAYCQKFQEVTESFDFKGFIYLRDDPDKVAYSLERPKIFGVSCYIWNGEYSKAVARSVKALHPDCLIVMGGPQVPLRSENVFIEHPYVDLLAHNEGEVTFYEILLEYLRAAPDYTRVPGLSVRVEGNRCHKTPPRDRVSKLAELVSPYLTGIFDDLAKLPYSWNASQETHRGCPYECTFCDWGSAVFTKVRAFGDEQLEAEFEWFGKHQVELLYNCDANYGILKRDYALTEKLVETKMRYGFPKQFRAAYAKNSNMKIFEIAKMFNRAEMDKGVTLSMQSMDNHTLDVIKRINIKVQDFENLLKLYRRENIPTYTELIMGLPGETYDSFVNGIDELLRSGQHDGLTIYMAELLPNSEMADPVYREQHGIKGVRMPMLWTHASPSAETIPEYFDIVVETKTLPTEDWKRVYRFSWAIQCFHCLSLTQYLAVFLHTEFQIAYRTFYEKTLDFARRNPETLIGQQFLFISGILNRVLDGGAWETIVPEFGDVMWPPEEATFLNIICEKDRFYAEMRRFIRELVDDGRLPLDEDLLSDLFEYQGRMVLDPFTPGNFSVNLKYSLHEYFVNAYLGTPFPLVKKESSLNVKARAEFGGDLETYAREIVWYGRKSSRVRQALVVETSY
jgi:radical SAM superfamily enzyme YgiQ (UPF0313 family)